MDDGDDVYSDTISVGSRGSASVSAERHRDRDRERERQYLSLSRHTIYHSAEDLVDYASAERFTMKERQAGEAVKAVQDGLDKSWNRFRDGQRSVDFVLAFDSDDDQNDHDVKRHTFEKRLEREGLVLEHEETQRIHFVKIHAPHEVLARYCEILKMKMPIKEIQGQECLLDPSFDLITEVKSLFSKCLDFIKLDPKIFKGKKYQLTAEFSRDREYLFDIASPDFFSTAVRCTVVDFILERQRFNDDETAVFDVGIERLLSEEVYRAAYPLHDGDYRRPGCERSLLFNEWGSVSKWIRYQPIDNIKDYFGVKFALYFAWLGFYTHMLIPASLVGLICFCYGLITLYSNTLSEDICNESLNITMCPLCDTNCDYWKLYEACTYARISYLFDNNATVFFAFFMSFWATLYLELWKRYSADITHRWGLTGFDHQAEHPRPQFLARLTHSKKQKLNVVTRVIEPAVPFWRMRFPATLLSFSVVLFLISIAVMTVFGVVIYRMSALASRNIFGANTDTMSYKIMVMPASAAVLNLVCITILNYVYDWLAVHLTELELLRTQTEFDDSLTLKIYLFQFVNYYASIFYIAFFKGKYVGYPKKYNRILGLRQEECSPGGCLMELCIQLAIIMVGKQAMNSLLEMIIPLITKWYTAFRIKAGLRKSDDCNDVICFNQWTEDFKLLEWGPRGLFSEYLEMIMQYGFVTIFVAAFPLAPFFALINNVLEMRLDAKKFLKYYRRPVPKRVKSIGVWFNIMDILGRLSVVTNAFIIAFSSNFIPRLVYVMVVNPNHTDEGFLNHSLAVFHTSDFQYGCAPLNASIETDICRYPEYRNPPSHEMPYKRPLIYWHILAARLAFVVVFQNVVGFVMMTVQWAIPDKSRKLRDRIKREAYLTNEIIITQEMIKARGELTICSNVNGGSGEPTEVVFRNPKDNGIAEDVV